LQFITEPDPYLSMLKWVITEMMRIEVEAKVGAAKGQHTKDRTTHFSGFRARRVDTRMGTVYLVVPKIRKGGYVPFFISERKRSEQALIAVVQEAFINGVSTRKIERLAHAMGIENISACQRACNNDPSWAAKNNPLDLERGFRYAARTSIVPSGDRAGRRWDDQV
jgi:transposase-like protein